ncbi:MAG: bifunctional phosphoribosylaminoimidazolecarboxamide formyltransferase/inosine monophosphate cyclohydrolase [Phycisphaerae bacterium]|jgi:phosphoribosylaminoimidazolecarboxamide formyltransferase/IMP cyclohydrolase
MSACRIRRALISVYDKTGVVEFARALHEEFGIELISTGGTAKTLTDAGLPVTLVEQVTGFPEMMDGRVKTLHPKIHAAILADRDNPEHMRQLAEQGIEPIDMVVVSLYPFERTIADPNCTFAQAIEMIDIGGPCLLRAAAKNHKHVLVLHDRTDCEHVLTWLRGDGLTDEGWQHVRRDFAASAFRLVCAYNAAIVDYLVQQGEMPGRFHALLLNTWDQPRYGENPHQSAEVLRPGPGLNVPPGPHLLGLDRTGSPADTELSFNNYADASAALELCAELTRATSRQPLSLASGKPSESPAPPVVCFIKHTNACGAASVAARSDSAGDGHAARVEAYRRAYLGDPNAAMGGILAVNFPVDAEFAEMVMETYGRLGKPLRESGHPNPPGAFFVEVWCAPAFDREAVQLIRGKTPDKPKKDWGRRVRLLAVGDMNVEPDASEMDLKRIAGGVLMQTRDLIGLNEDQWQVVTRRQPTAAEMDDLRLAWLVCKHTKSNAITICGDGMLLGNGAGQMSRVMSCRIATWLARENGHGDRLAGSAAASDAFFPFRDGPDILADAGVTALIQPGGSKRDQEVIDAANERNLAMVFTGTRHFKH